MISGRFSYFPPPSTADSSEGAVSHWATGHLPTLTGSVKRVKASVEARGWMAPATPQRKQTEATGKRSNLAVCLLGRGGVIDGWWGVGRRLPTIWVHRGGAKRLFSFYGMAQKCSTLVPLVFFFSYFSIVRCSSNYLTTPANITKNTTQLKQYVAQDTDYIIPRRHPTLWQHKGWGQSNIHTRTSPESTWAAPWGGPA